MKDHIGQAVLVIGAAATGLLLPTLWMLIPVGVVAAGQVEEIIGELWPVALDAYRKEE